MLSGFPTPNRSFPQIQRVRVFWISHADWIQRVQISGWRTRTAPEAARIANDIKCSRIPPVRVSRKENLFPKGRRSGTPPVVRLSWAIWRRSPADSHRKNALNGESEPKRSAAPIPIVGGSHQWVTVLWGIPSGMSRSGRTDPARAPASPGRLVPERRAIPEVMIRWFSRFTACPFRLFFVSSAIARGPIASP